jgi:hypothetical protein
MSRIISIVFAVLFGALAGLGQQTAHGPLAPSDLRCEYLINPMGIDVTRPRLFWIPEHNGRGAAQTAYQILVSAISDPQAGDQWDSGKVASGEFTHVVYGGKQLESERTYYWKVRYWDQDGRPSPYSRAARFETGLLAASDWKAKWIRGGNQLRKEFSLPAPPVRARAYVSGIGYYELRLNNKKVGDRVLDPGKTNYDRRVLYATYDLIRDDQQADGSVLNVVPQSSMVKPPTDPAWGAAYPLLALYMYERYGDWRVLEEHFEGLRRWADFLRTNSRNNISSVVRFGDWVAIERTPGDLVSTAFYYWSVDVVARVAGILGKNAEAESYGKLAGEIRDAFHKKFYNPDIAAYGTGTQTANVLPLYLDMVPKEVRSAVLRSLRDDLIYTHNTHLTTGILGAKYIMPLLTRTGRPDLAYELATQTSYPGWGYMIENGATTLWEIWQNKTGPGMNSQNHPMLGSVGT